MGLLTHRPTTSLNFYFYSHETPTKNNKNIFQYIYINKTQRVCIEEKQRLWLQGCGLRGLLHTSGSLSSTEGSLLVNQMPNFFFHLNQFMVSWSAVSYLGTDQSKVIALVDLIYVFVGMLDLINLERNDLVFSNGLCLFFSLGWCRFQSLISLTVWGFFFSWVWGCGI